MKKTPHLLFLVFCLIVLTAGCCREKTSITIGLSPEAKSYLPYSDGSQIWFLYNNRDTIKTTIFAKTDSTEADCVGDCCERVFQGYYNLSIKKANGDIFAEISAADNILSFYYNSNRFADLTIDNTSKIAVCDTTKGSFCYDSLLVNNRMHYNVFRLIRFYQQGDAKQLFYTKERGILRVEYNNGDVYQTF